jgi:hypothetical protein
MEINIKSIPKDQHRYSTCGDFWYDPEGVLQIRVTEMDKRSMMLVVFHEMVEQFITEDRGIREEDILKFDLEYEKNRAEGDESEPGDDVNAPYRKEHRFAENIERMIAHEINFTWSDYETKINDEKA